MSLRSSWLAACAALASLACLLGAGGCAPEQVRATGPGSIWTVDETDIAKDAATAKRLDQNLPKVEFSAVPLEQVIDFLREATACSIHVRWIPLEQAGVNKDTPVDVKLTDTTFGKGLRVVLEDAGGINSLGYVIEEGVVIISTPEDLSRRMVTRVYDVGDLVPASRWSPAERVLVRELVASTMREPIRSPDRSQTLADAFEGRVDALLDALEASGRRRDMLILRNIVQGMIGEDWYPNERGTLWDFGDRVVVTHTREVQSRIARLLSALRRQTETVPAEIPATIHGPGPIPTTTRPSD